MEEDNGSVYERVETLEAQVSALAKLTALMIDAHFLSEDDGRRRITEALSSFAHYGRRENHHEAELRLYEALLDRRSSDRRRTVPWTESEQPKPKA